MPRGRALKRDSLLTAESFGVDGFGLEGFRVTAAGAAFFYALGLAQRRRAEAYFCAPFVPDPELVEIGDNVILAGERAFYAG